MINMWVTYGEPRLYSNGEFDLITKPLLTKRTSEDQKMRSRSSDTCLAYIRPQLPMLRHIMVILDCMVIQKRIKSYS